MNFIQHIVCAYKNTDKDRSIKAITSPILPLLVNYTWIVNIELFPGVFRQSDVQGYGACRFYAVILFCFLVLILLSNVDLVTFPGMRYEPVLGFRAFQSSLIEISRCPLSPSLIILCSVEKRMSFKFLSNFEM